MIDMMTNRVNSMCHALRTEYYLLSNTPFGGPDSISIGTIGIVTCKLQVKYSLTV